MLSIPFWCSTIPTRLEFLLDDFPKGLQGVRTNQHHAVDEKDGGRPRPQGEARHCVFFNLLGIFPRVQASIKDLLIQPDRLGIPLELAVRQGKGTPQGEEYIVVFPELPLLPGAIRRLG